MNREHGVSRRASLKGLGAMGAAIALGGAVPAQAQAELKPARNNQDKLPASVADLAVARFGKGHSWAQAVFSAVAEQIGMDYQTAVRVSAGFGGGMSLGSVCGAVTGGIMAIGLKCGGLGAQAAQTGKLVREFTSRFKAQHRTVNCSELTGMDVTNVELVKKLSADLSKPENLAAAKEALGGRDPKELYAACGAYVRDATKSVSELLNDAPK